jgi:hypothetical protein
MFTKTTIALAAAAIIGVSLMALAADDDQHGGFRQLGPGGVVTQGINPVEHPSLSGIHPNVQTETARPAARLPKAEDDYGPEAGKE